MAHDRDRDRNRQGRDDEGVSESRYYARARNRASRGGPRGGGAYGSTAGYGSSTGYGAADYPTGYGAAYGGGGYGGYGGAGDARGGYPERGGWNEPPRGEPGWGTRQREEYRGAAPDVAREYGRDYWRDYGGREGGGRGHSERDFSGREVGRSEEYVGGMGYVGNTGIATGRGGRRSRWRREPLTAAEIMTRNVKAVTPDSPIREVAQIMRDENTGVVPVVDQNHQLRGLVTDRDIVMRSLPEGLDPTNMRAADLMTEDVEAVTADESLRAVVDLMGEKQVRRVPVVDENDRLVGIISMADVATRADYDEDLQDALEEISSRRSFWSKVFG